MRSALLTLSLIAFCFIANAQDQEFNLNKTYSITSGGMIEMRSSDAEVTIAGSDRKDVQVNIHRKVTVKGLSFGERDFDVEIFEEGGDLIIKERSGGSISMMGYYREEYTIDIEAPRNVSLRIEGDDEDYQIRNIDGSIALNIDDGDAELKGCGGKEFKFDFDDGDVVMDSGAGSLFVKADDGDVTIRNANFYEIEASMDDGDIEIETSLANNGEYYFRSSDGGIFLDITSGGGDFVIYHDDTRVSHAGGFNVEVEEDDETRLTLADGTAKVKIRADDGRVRLTARSRL